MLLDLGCYITDFNDNMFHGVTVRVRAEGTISFLILVICNPVTCPNLNFGFLSKKFTPARNPMLSNVFSNCPALDQYT